MARAVTISSSAGTLNFGAESGVRARAQMRGTGLPPVNLQWFEGAGDGAQARGARVLTRTIDLPVKITGADRQSVWERFSLLAQIIAPTVDDVRLTITLDGVDWYTIVRRSGGGDPSWDEDTDGSTVLLTTITFEAGDPYWQRADQESKIITPAGLGRGLLGGVGALSGLEVSSTTALGTVNFTNTGDVDAYPMWLIEGPFTGFTLTSPDGKILQYVGTKLLGDSITIDTALGTIVNETSGNEYSGLQPAPRFWTIPKGDSVATVELLDAVGSESSVAVYWRPRKWVLF